MTNFKAGSWPGNRRHGLLPERTRDPAAHSLGLRPRAGASLADKSEVDAPQKTCPDQQTDDPAPEEPVPLAGSSDGGTSADGDPALAPLCPEEVGEVHRRVLALPQAARQELTQAFREHFQVPRNARSIGDRISQRQHSDFIALFLEEAQGGQEQVEPPAAPSP